MKCIKAFLEISSYDRALGHYLVSLRTRVQKYATPRKTANSASSLARFLQSQIKLNQMNNIPAPKTIRNACVDSIEVADGYVGIIYKRDNKSRYAVFDETIATRVIKTGDTITFQKRFDAQNDVLISNQNQFQPTLF